MYKFVCILNSGLLERLGGMIRQVLNTKYDYNREKSEQDNIAMAKSCDA